VSLEGVDVVEDLVGVGLGVHALVRELDAAVGVAVLIVGCNASPWLFGGAERIPGNGFWWVLGVLVVALAAYMSSCYYVCRRTLPESDAGSGSNAKT